MVPVIDLWLDAMAVAFILNLKEKLSRHATTGGSVTDGGGSWATALLLKMILHEKIEFI